MSERQERILFKFTVLLYFFIFAAYLPASNLLPEVEIDYITEYTHEIEYDFLNWTSNAAWIKLKQASLNSPHYIAGVERKEIVLKYFQNMEQVLNAEWELEQIYTNPEIPDPESASSALKERLDALYAEQRQIAPFAESVLEAQVSAALTEASLTTVGQPIPQPLYHISALPMVLIISPRDIIRRDEQVMLLADFPVNERNALEEKIFTNLNLSALVEPVGGVGTYPTMGMRSTNLPWTFNTIAHEWTHNYLSWHPLGWNYSTTPELRIINETVASIVGGEISKIVLERDYPEFLDESERPRFSLLALNQQRADISLFSDPNPFDFRPEMHETRVHVDELLSIGKIIEAEAYMEMRRQYLWQNGYAIRKLNQAYFAFHGAYADLPGGAAGEDPVGPAVRKLRTQSDSLADFLHSIMKVNSFEELLEMVEE